MKHFKSSRVPARRIQRRVGEALSECLGNPGTGTPTLAYGTATGAGPFRCESATTGVTCTANGKGFQISTSGVTPALA